MTASPMHVGVAALAAGGWLVLWGALDLLGVSLPYEMQACVALGFSFGTAWLIDKRADRLRLRSPQTEEERLLARIRDDYSADRLDEEQMEEEIAAVILRGETPKRLQHLPPPKPSADSGRSARPPLAAMQMRRLAAARRGRPRPLRVDGYYGYYGRYTAAQLRQRQALLGYENRQRSEHYPGGGLDISAQTIRAGEITDQPIDPEHVFRHPELDDCLF